MGENLESLWESLAKNHNKHLRIVIGYSFMAGHLVSMPAEFSHAVISLHHCLRVVFYRLAWSRN